MRRLFLPLAAAVLFAVCGCVGDILSTTDDPIYIEPYDEDDIDITIIPDDAVITTFPSSGEGAGADDIANSTFVRLINVEYSSGGTSISGQEAVADSLTATVNGNQVTINYIGHQNIVYKLTGTANDGFFKLYSVKKQAIWLSNLSLTNSVGAAVNNQSKKRTFVYVEGENMLADGGNSKYEKVGEEDCKATFFSEGQLVFSGSGSLTVKANNAQGKSALASDDYVRILSGPSITLSALAGAGHGINVNDYFRMGGGTLSITTKAAMKKGITSDDYVLIEGGIIDINVSGGVAKDDDGEYTGTAGIKADNYFAMTGGEVTITNSGAGGKGVRAGSYNYDSKNHTLADSYITGGKLTITTSGSETSGVSAKGIKIGYKESTSGSSSSWGWGRNNYTCAGNMKVNGGEIIVNCSNSEGFEVKGDLTFNGGETYVFSGGDDAINCQGELNVNGGYVFGYSTGNDGIDSNGDMKLNGGFTFGITTRGAPEVALDANTEGGYKLYINSGATMVAYGGLESGYSAAQSVYNLTGMAGAWNGLWDGSKFIAAFKAPAGISTFAVSAPGLSQGYKSVTVSSADELCNGTWAVNGISGGTATDLSTYSGGNGGFGPGGPRW
ncbi:MAG: carbohydrate-binding domain-containing protein [Bacteroidales bacterium]|nr:carbohydrate-binding domain-containing protein [Bacteroidales bacterium]